MPFRYKNFSDWYYEIESFSVRAERLPHSTECIAAMQAAFEAGRQIKEEDEDASKRD